MIESKTSRVYWIDALKGVGIIFVVLGHTLGIGAYIDKYIFSFHMPLFFFASGFLIKNKDIALSFKEFSFKYLRLLIIPYVFFGVVTYFPWLFFTRHFGENALIELNPIKPILGILYGSGTDGWLYHNVMLWFFPCLFMVHVMFRSIARAVGMHNIKIMVIPIAVIGYVLSIAGIPRMPWGVDIAITGLAFYMIGNLSRGIPERLNELKAFSVYMVLLAALCVQVTAIHYNGRIDMNSLLYGNPILFYSGALSGILFWAIICIRSQELRILSKIGRNSIIIFPLHRLSFSIITWFGIYVFNMDVAFKQTLIASLIYTSVSIFFLLLAAPLMRRYMPYFIGMKASNKST